VQIYFRYLADQMEKALQNGKASTKEATELVRVARNADVVPRLHIDHAQTDINKQSANVQSEKPRLLLVPRSDRRYKVRNR
jgi:hypothetical protein